ncbi:MAG: tetratricopeptide repeat protein [Pseudomonadota bacterium]
MKRFKLLALLVTASILGACASAPPPAATQPPLHLFVDSAFKAPAQRIEAAEIFALSPAMKRYLDVEIAPLLRSMGRQRGLVEALHSKAQLRLDYDTDSTRTAAEAFDARAGNCLSLVVMSAALARHLELPIQFQALLGQETWSRSGDLSLVNGHVNITVAKRLVDRLSNLDADAQLRLDFGVLPAGRGSLLQVVSERTITAMFMNNRAAEALVRGATDEAYAYAREAVVQDPGYAGASNTLGVIYQRSALAGAAERAYRHALDRDEKHRAAMLNLSRLLEAQGRNAEAVPWRAKLAQLEAEPPFHYFDLGRAEAQAGNFRAARDHILREMRRDPDYHEFHFWLAVSLYGLGDVVQAREHLTKAMNNSTTRREQSLYASKLQRLTPTSTTAQ